VFGICFLNPFDCEGKQHPSRGPSEPLDLDCQSTVGPIGTDSDRAQGVQYTHICFCVKAAPASSRI